MKNKKLSCYIDGNNNNKNNNLNNKIHIFDTQSIILLSQREKISEKMIMKKYNNVIKNDIRCTQYYSLLG